MLWATGGFLNLPPVAIPAVGGRFRGRPACLHRGPWHSHPAACQRATAAWPGVTPVSPRTAGGSPSSARHLGGGWHRPSPRIPRGCPPHPAVHDPPTLSPASAAWHGRVHIVPNLEDFEQKACAPPHPLHPHHVQLGWGGGRKSFTLRKRQHGRARACSAEPPPPAPQTRRGPPAPHGVPPHPQSRRLPRTTHLWAQRTKNKTQTTTQSSNPPTPQVKVKAEKTQKAPETP